jgi:hypothetical protein
MADRLLLIFALHNGEPIAGALNLIGSDTLYGRYWGAVADVPHLHFELCYYQAIDHAIAHGLARVEAGAQGGHKLSRGYRPVPDLLRPLPRRAPSPPRRRRLPEGRTPRRRRGDRRARRDDPVPQSLAARRPIAPLVASPLAQAAMLPPFLSPMSGERKNHENRHHRACRCGRFHRVCGGRQP